MANKLCALISQGVCLEQIITGDYGLKFTRSFVWKWINEDAEFAQMYAHARARLADHYADKIALLIDATDSINSNAMRVKIDGLKWITSKLLPKVYGEPQQMLTINNTTNVAIISEEKRQELMARHQKLIAGVSTPLLNAAKESTDSQGEMTTVV